MAKTKALIIFAVTAKLICVFVFAYADCWFSDEAAQMTLDDEIFNIIQTFDAHNPDKSIFDQMPHFMIFVIWKSIHFPIYFGSVYIYMISGHHCKVFIAKFI